MLLNHCLTIRTTCPSEALTVCIGLFELISNWFVELELVMLGEPGLDVRFSFGFVSELIRPVVELLVSGPIAKLEADSFVRPLHLKYRKCTIFLVGSLHSVTLTNTVDPRISDKRTVPDTLKETFEYIDYTNSNNQSF